MNLFPPLPSWDASHPIIVHLPLGAFAIVPIFVVLAIATREQWSKAFSISALVVLLVGVAGAMLAVMSGEAAHEIAEGASPLAELADPVMEEHEELAELARTVFAVLGVLYLGVVIGSSALGKKGKAGLVRVVHAGFLVLYVPALVLLSHVGHLGGRLVHEFGIHAPIARYTTDAVRAQPLPFHDEDDDD